MILDILQWIEIFVLIFLADVFWVLCVRRVQDNSAFMAGVWSVGIFLPTAFVIAGYVNNLWLLIPACLGHFCGTAATVKWEQKLKRKLTNNHDNS